MNYRLNLGAWGSVFAVPSSVVDNYIKTADGDHIKVLLYMLKNNGSLLMSEDIAPALGLDRDTVEEAFLFWKNTGILSGENENLNFMGQAPSAAPTAPSPSAAASAVPERNAAVAKLTSDTQFPPREIANAVNSDRAFRYLCETFERHAGRPTKHSERNTLMVITEEVGIPVEVAVMMVEYCFSIDKATPAYMKTVAKDWYESGIDTIPKAEERIEQLKAKNSLEGRLRNKFCMTSAFSAKQKEYITGWAALEISDELIDEAYEKTLNATGKLSFPYMDSILRSWAEKGYKTLEQVSNDKSTARNTASQSVAASFDINQLEQSAYERYRKKK